MDKKLRFAPLIRVSTERQQNRGESLGTQTRQIQQYVELLGGEIPENCRAYSGQEHATGEWERKKLDALLRDSAKGFFDAVIVTDPTRWSRDNRKSKEGLEILKNNGIKFFIGSAEYDLYSPDHSFILGISCEFAELQAKTQTIKSTIARIDRAKRNVPTGGALPFGRTFNKRTEEWGIDKEKKRLVERAAKAYLEGENLKEISKKENIDYSTLLKNLQTRCGDTWMLVFDVPKLNIYEEVQMKIPRLLDESTIQAVRERAESNKTVTHGQYKNKYLLSRMVICGHCGEALSGQTDTSKNFSYPKYRHRSVSKCKAFTGIMATDIENAVFSLVFRALGDKKKIEEAAYAAIPDLKEIENTEANLDDAKKKIAEIQKKMKILMQKIASELISDEDVAPIRKDFKEREVLLEADIVKYEGFLERLPQKEQIERTAQLMARVEESYSRSVHRLNEMNFEEKRRLMELVFAGKGIDGKRNGIYVLKDEDKWFMELKGVFYNDVETFPMSDNTLLEIILGIGTQEVGALTKQEKQVALGYKLNRRSEGG